MKIFKFVCLYSLSIFILLIMSCDEGNPLIAYSSYNLLYQDTILFRSYRSAGITLSYIDGSGARTICDTMAAFHISWSPNKRKIIFVGRSINDQNNIRGIYLVDIKNSLPIRIVPQENKVQCATYSPNMQYIAYSVSGDTLGYKIKLLNLLNDQIEDLTDWIYRQINTLSWSSDSKNILMDDGYVVNIVTRELKVLFTFSGQTPSIVNPNWSPDGNKIAFCGETLDNRSNICIYDLKSGETKVLYEKDELQFTATWSKDGSQLIFDQRPYGNGRSYLCKIDVDGTNFVQITDGQYWENQPCWYK